MQTTGRLERGARWTLSIGMVLLAGVALAQAPGGATQGKGGTMEPDVTLTALTLSVGTISPTFTPGRKAYVARVGQAVTSVAVNGVPSEPGATIRVNGTAPAPQTPAAVALDPGRNEIVVEILSPEGERLNSYRVSVTRAHPTPDWVQVNAAAPWPARDSAGELVFRDRLWLLGGYLPELTTDVWSSADGKDWQNVGNIPCPSGVNIPVNAVHDGRMWVVCNKGELYASADGITWTLVTDQAPWRGRYAAGGAAFNGRLWVMGGLGSGRIHNDIWSSADGVTWTQEVAQAPWAGRQLFSVVVVHAGRLWIVGGGVTSYHPFKTYTDVWSSADGRTWEKVTDEAPWQGRIWTTALSYRGRLWLMGGFQSEPVWRNLDDVWYSADGKEWRRLETESIWSARHEFSAYVYQDKLWVVAGNSWPLKNDVWRLDIPGLVFLTQPVVEGFVNAEYLYRARADFGRTPGAVSYRLVEAPAWLTVDGATGVLRGVPAQAEKAQVTLEAVAPGDETARQTFTVHIQGM